MIFWFLEKTLIENCTLLDDNDDLREGTYHLSDGIKA